MPELYHDPDLDVNAELPRPSYYAVVPAPVRYHPDLPPAAKLFYGELTALCSVSGFCWASNTYFMQLYSVSRPTVQNWLTALSQAGFIRVDFNQSTNERKIFLTQTEGVQKNVGTGAKKIRHPYQENLAQSNKESIKKNLVPENVATVQGISAIRRHKEEEQKGSASPPIFDVPESVSEVVTLTGDVGSWSRFRQLWQIVVKEHREQVWQDAVNATRTAMEGARKPVERPGAYFQAILTHKLNAVGVRVPGGSRSEREEIRRIIAKSFAAAS